MGWGAGRNGWGTYGSDVPQYGNTVTDQNVMSSIQLSLLEPDTAGATYASGIWTQAQVLQYLNDRQRKFLSESGISVMIVYQAGTANTSRYALPQNTIDVRRVSWANEAMPMTYIELPRADAWELDHGVTGWPTKVATSPQVYMEDHEQSLTIEVNPIPNDIGEMELIATAQGRQMDGTGILLSVPDDYSPFIAWGVRADMLNGEYEGNDPVRAAHAEQRFMEGIELGRIVTGEV